MSTPCQPGLPSYPWYVHGNRYRSVEFFDQPWIASPTYKPPDFPLHPLDVAYSGDDLFPTRTNIAASIPPSDQAIRQTQRSRRNILRRLLKVIFRECNIFLSLIPLAEPYPKPSTRRSSSYFRGLFSSSRGGGPSR